MLTMKLTPLLAVLPLLLAGELIAQSAERGRFTISGTAGYYTVTRGTLFSRARVDDALGVEGAVRWEFAVPVALGGVVQYASYAVSGEYGDFQRRFTSLLLEARCMLWRGNIDPFIALRGGVSFQSAPGDSENDKGWVVGGALGARYWVGSSVAIEVGAALTWVLFGDLVMGDDGAWLSLSAGVTAAFPGRG